ncbi:structural maintenance of chromosomes protein 4 [Caerostris extrusa]|uniref:Structural maintenance of chromosomes protein 4 n=1 Tax=Caerostris extrusa TaxID=172846 RepID=A0AAV4Y2L5_CAEEX|nr:structural maintenance of chromosomes protein 4 [Caerostris extrusa]
MMKPKALNDQETGMLEYIEDIIGSNRFMKPIQHFHTKTEEANEKRIEKLNQLKIVEKERADAEKPRAKAMEYIQLANKMTLLENCALQSEIKVAAREGEQMNEDKIVLSDKIDALSASLDELQSNKQIKEEDLKVISSDWENSTKKSVKNSQKTLQAEELKMTNIQKQPDPRKNKKLTKLMGSVKDEIQEFQETKDKYEEELIILKSVVNDKKSELDLAQSELDLLLSSEKKEQDNLSAFETEYEKTTSLIKEEEILLKKVHERIPELKSQISSSEKQLIEKEKRECSLIEELKIKCIKLDEAKSSLNATQDRNTLVKAFMEQKKMGKLKGVYGRLGDLGAIDLKYDVAISTACGPLDNIVTDSIATAQECVELLKRDKLGYATFIALDQMKKWEPHTKEKNFYSRRFANDLDQATRVGLKGAVRHRVVTLKGELIDMSGTMSGGGGKAFKGRMGQSVMENSFSQKEIDKLTEEVEIVSNELTEIKKSKLELKENIEAGNKELSTLQHSVKKSKLNCEGLREKEKMLLNKLRSRRKKY